MFGVPVLYFPPQDFMFNTLADDDSEDEDDDDEEEEEEEEEPMDTTAT